MSNNEEYHKIQSLFLRNPDTKFTTFLPRYTCPEFEYLKDNEWIFTEKVDGTNVRVHWDHRTKSVTIGGRTKDAQMPTFLYSELLKAFTPEKLSSCFQTVSATLYGEGYGAKIQKGGGDYIKDGCGFILFDIALTYWLGREDLEINAEKLGIPLVPIISQGGLGRAVELCISGFDSKLRSSPPEGLVIKPAAELRARNGNRIITKLKLKDFKRESHE